MSSSIPSVLEPVKDQKHLLPLENTTTPSQKKPRSVFRVFLAVLVLLALSSLFFSRNLHTCSRSSASLSGHKQQHKSYYKKYTSFHLSRPLPTQQSGENNPGFKNYFDFNKRQSPTSALSQNYDPADYTRLFVYSSIDSLVNITFGYAQDDSSLISFAAQAVQPQDPASQVDLSFVTNERQGVTLYVNPLSPSVTTGFLNAGSVVNVNITLPRSLTLLTSFIVYVENMALGVGNTVNGNAIDALNINYKSGSFDISGLNATSASISSTDSDIYANLTVNSVLNLQSVSGNIGSFVNFANPSNSTVQVTTKSGNVTLAVLSDSFSSGTFDLDTISGSVSVYKNPDVNGELSADLSSAAHVNGTFNIDSKSDIPSLANSVNVDINSGIASLLFF
ncbi:hypothetical protein BB560_001270 [Smittium megazygosporum]|uniref:DUF4097 domain-containing protein n=1 Tax=Smittium megazygosporum TaxID=133381 RepID=A0A2T9ZHZ8_9FUNG|nr:hypothetical protein BB560_001270 [Smittium megazygosporum]